jgi:hypothetical protein
MRYKRWACSDLLDAKLLQVVPSPITSKSHQNNRYPKIGLRDGKQVEILDEEHDLQRLPAAPHWKVIKLVLIMPHST